MADAAKPYVGPYAFEEKDAPLFFGRDEEARKLLDAVISERVVLLYSASGAGKTSLINARLIPELRGQSFDVLPVARVGGSPGAGITPANVFVYSALRTLACPKTDLSTLVDCTLDAFLRLRPRAAAEVDFLGRVLILDQFEEILTTHPERWEDRRGFFLQLRQALLDDSALTVVLSLREDHLAGLDPFAGLLPGQLRTRRLEPLLRRQALDAIRKPAEQAGRSFEPGVAERLVDNLSQVHIAGQEATVVGELVEPVQLQVVCYQLWENLNGRPGQSISEQDRLDFGDVDQALERFYNSAMERAAQESGISTGRIRRWCGAALITPTRIRSQVSREAETSGGLPNAVVDRLLDLHLIRAEATRGGIWYELAHDRFIDPVLRSNEIAQPPEAARLPAAARAWKDSGRDPSYLFRGQRLKNASGLAEDSQSALSKLEMEFLSESRTAEAAERARVRETRRLRILVALLLALSVAATILYVRLRRTSQESESRAQALGAVTEPDPWKGLQLALESVEQARSSEAEKALHRTLEATEVQLSPLTLDIGNQPYPSQLKIGNPSIFALSRDGRKFVAFDADDSVAVWDSASGNRLANLGKRAPEVTSAACVGDEVATGDYNGRVSLWSLQGRRLSSWQTGSPVNGLAFCPQSSLLAVAGEDHDVTLWRLPSGRKWKTLRGHAGAVLDVTFSSGCESLASADDDGNAILWDLESGKKTRTSQDPEHNPAVSAVGFENKLATAWVDLKQTARLGVGENVKTLAEGAASNLAFSSDGHFLATAGLDTTLKLWNTSSGSLIQTLEPKCGSIHRVAFLQKSQQELILAATCGELQKPGEVKLWSLVPQHDIHTLLAGGALLSVGFTPGRRVVATDSAGIVNLWDQSGKRQQWAASKHPLRQAQLSLDGKWLAFAVKGGPPFLQETTTARSIPLGTQEAERVAFSPDSKLIVAAGSDGVLRFWNMHGIKKHHDLPRHLALDVAFSPQGKLLAIAYKNQDVELWNLSRDSGIHLPAKGRALAFSPDGERLAIGTAKSHIDIWNLTSGAKQLELERRRDQAVTKLAFSPDGRRLASIGSSDDSSVRIWDSETGKENFSLQGHKGFISDMAFSPDNGRWLATASTDGTVRLEPIHIADLKRLAQSRLKAREVH